MHFSVNNECVLDGDLIPSGQTQGCGGQVGGGTTQRGSRAEVHDGKSHSSLNLSQRNRFQVKAACAFTPTHSPQSKLG